jgi:hypothetical protein
MNCVLAVTVEVSEEAKWVLKKIAEQHAMVNMRVNLDESITISQGVEDNPSLEDCEELADSWEEVTKATLGDKLPF